MNPYGFVHMEKWLNEKGQWDICVAKTVQGVTYITFDVREDVNGYYPVFSESDRVGSNEGPSQEKFEAYIYFASCITGRSKEELLFCRYDILNVYKNCLFNVKETKRVKEEITKLVRV